MKSKLIIILAFSIFFFACSSSEETTQKEEASEPEIYVFDDVTPADSADVVTPPSEPEPTVDVTETQYFVQVGAFTTQGRADQFVKENLSKTKYKLEISYSDDVKLFVVRLPAFNTKSEAEKVRNEFWQSGLFNDAFIVTK